jgi:hypothetical protein
MIAVKTSGLSSFSRSLQLTFTSFSVCVQFCFDAYVGLFVVVLSPSFSVLFCSQVFAFCACFVCHFFFFSCALFAVTARFLSRAILPGLKQLISSPLLLLFMFAPFFFLFILLAICFHPFQRCSTFVCEVPAIPFFFLFFCCSVVCIPSLLLP